MAQPGFWDIQENAQKIVSELKTLKGQTEPLQDVIRRADDAQLRQVAVREGMTTLREDAWRKVQAGLTTVEEAVRVTGEV